MPIVTFRRAMPVSADELYAWHRRPNAFVRLNPPWEKTRIISSTGPWGDGTRWTFRTSLIGPVAMTWLAEHYGVIEGRQFCDRELKGPFAKWEHTHRFIPDGETSILEDTIDYTLPLGLPGRILAAGMIRRRVETMFAYRQEITAEELSRHLTFTKQPRLTVAITGSRGLIGESLVSFLTTGGHSVRRLVSGKSQPPRVDDGTDWQTWHANEPLPPGLLTGVDAVVHLAGEPIVGLWTKTKKARIRESRIVSTKHLAEAIDRDGVPTFVCGSAIGFYGDRGEETLTEASSVGDNFLADVCRDWEAASQCQARVANLRTSLVLSPLGGALAPMLRAFRLGGGAVVGNGRQWNSWIGIHDMVYAIHHILMTPSLSGPVNMCTANPVTNRVFGRTLAKVLHRPYLFTVPAFALKLLPGEFAKNTMLASQNATPTKLQSHNYRFFSKDLDSTLRLLLPEHRTPDTEHHP